MSHTDSAKQKADAAAGRGRTVLGSAQQRLAETREQIDAARADSVARLNENVEALAEATRKQVLAFLGAGDLAVTAVARRAGALPATARDVADQVSGQGERTVRDVRDRSGQVVHGVTQDPQRFVQDRVSGAREGAKGYVTLARTVFDGLAERGEQVAADLSRDPRLLRVLTVADKVVGRTADSVADAAGDVADSADDAASDVRRRARSVRSQAKSVSREAAHDSRSVAATKAAATRKANAEKRSAVATKAAATRKANARAAKRTSAKASKTTGAGRTRTTSARSTGK